MPDLRAKRRPHKTIDWFGLFSSALFVFVGALLMGRGLWHMLMHHDLMLRSVVGGILFGTVGMLFAREALKPAKSSRKAPGRRH